MTLSFTVSQVDAFRRYREEEEMTLAQILRTLRGQDEPTEAMLGGRALHSILETIDAAGLPDEEFTTVTSPDEEHAFTFECDIPLVVKPLRELRGERTYDIGGELVTLRGRADVVGGIDVEDHKLTSQFDAERYMDRYQWRCYLSIFGAQKFTYNVFVTKDPKQQYDCTLWTIRAFHTLTLYRYPELDADVMGELAQLAQFAKANL